MPMAAIRDGNLSVESRGRGEPLLFIHGAAVADAFGPMLNAGSFEAAFQVITYHRRGFQGSSGVLAAPSMAEEAADAAAVLDHFGIQKAHVVGHSFGADVALQMAVDHQNRVHSVSLFEPALMTMPSAEGFGAGLGPVVEQFQGGDVPGALVAFLTLVGGEAPLERLGALPPEATEQAIADFGTFFAGDVVSLGAFALDAAALGAMRQPTLTILGTNSAPIFHESMAFVRGSIPGVEAATLVGASHFMQMEKPVESAQILKDFLLRHTVAA